MKRGGRGNTRGRKTRPDQTWIEGGDSMNQNSATVPVAVIVHGEGETVDEDKNLSAQGHKVIPNYSPALQQSLSTDDDRCGGDYGPSGKI